jgi:hypothetical protein
LALFTGYDYREFAGKVDYTIAIVSWLQSHALNFPAALAWMLTNCNPKVSERDALRVAYKLAGWDGISGMPQSIGGIGTLREEREAFEFIPAYEEMLAGEIRKARLLTWGNGCVPVLLGNGWPKESVDGLAKLALDIGCEGIIYQAYRLPWQ